MSAYWIFKLNELISLLEVGRNLVAVASKELLGYCNYSYPFNLALHY